MKGTREEVLLQLEHWLTDEQDQYVFWLNGLAGTGKSTIAQTFAEMSFADGRLGASFFCSRDFEDRSNLQAIFPTLAFQLAYRYPPFREGLLRVLKASPDVGRETLCSQMERLIVGPFKATRISTLIIIDALDECKDEEPASAILSIFSRYVEQIPYVKFFITGRPEPRIRSGFRLAALRPITEVFKLHHVKRPLVDTDIKLFFRVRLADIASNRSHCDVTEDWPLSSDVNILCDKAAGLFIYASTVIKFVASPHHQPPRRLAILVSLPQSTTHEGESGIDSLYTEILRHAYRGVGPGDQNSDSREVYYRFRSVVGAVLLVFNPLSMKSLSSLLHDFDTPSDISAALNSLHSLLLVPDGTEDSIRAFHKSFPDFLMDPKRCQDTRFFVDPPVHHTEILLSCLHLMEERLRRNICNLDDYADLSDVNDLSACRKKHIGEALGYACQFWTKHLAKSPRSGPDAGEVQKAIDKFFTTYLLFWIEVLITMRNLDVGVHSINDIQQWYISVSYEYIIYCDIYLPFIQGGFFCKWINDSQHFILEHFDTISNCPSHIYYSALPLSPPTSWLQKCYSTEFSQEVKMVKGSEAGWGTCSRTVLLDSRPLALSYWNNTIAVGFWGGDIIILNSITGSQIVVLSGHTDKVNCLTFSSDGKSLVSGSHDNAVKLWDMQTGGVVKTFHGHTLQVQSVSISIDHTRISSGSNDKTIHLWDIQTGGCLCIIKQNDTVDHVSFSLINPQHIISISCGKVWQWDVNGHQIPPTYDGTHIAFSPDYTQFALCNENFVIVQYSHSRETVAEFHVANSKTEYCCFSPDGRLVAVAAGDTAYVWDITSPDPHLIETFFGHTDFITSIVFSSPSSLISISFDESVKFWQISGLSKDPAATDLGSAPSNLPSIMSVSLQAKAGIAVSSDEDGVVKTWDISTGLCKASFKIPTTEDTDFGDTKQIDGKLISVWHEDEKIHIWDTGNGELLQILDISGSAWCGGLRISGDGSKVFCLLGTSIQAWSMWTWEPVGEVEVGLEGTLCLDSLCIDGSRVQICSEDLSAKEGWDFGIPDSSPVPFDPSIGRLQLDFIGGALSQTDSPPWIKDTVTGKKVFQLSGEYAKPIDTQWDGQYLVAGYQSGEVLVLDFHHVLNRDI
jgi:WD40 repeat protein